MNIKLIIILLVSCFNCLADTYYIGASSYLAESDAALKSTVLFALETMSPGDKAVLYDAYNLKQVVAFQIPTDRIYEKNARARALHLKSELGAIKQFFTTPQPHPQKMNSAINLPQFLQLVGSQPRQGNTKVILIGSSIYRNLTESSFDMDSGFPSDGHILASERESVFGTANRKTLLAGVVVHFAYSQASFVNELHKEMVGRFYSLYIKNMQGVLASFVPDMNLAFSRAKENIQEPFINAQIDPEDSKLQMHRAMSREIPTWFTEAKPAPGPVNPEPIKVVLPTLQVPPADPPTSTWVPPEQRHITGIGIRWESKKCDFDLWVKPTPNSDQLYYGNTSTCDGKYFRDYQNRNADEGDEYVEITTPVDLKQLKCWVNFYSGKTSRPEGWVIIYSGGNTYRAPFSFKSKRGNKGQGDANKIGDCWTAIPVAEIIGK